MTHDESAVFRIDCPLCQGTLIIDRETGDVLEALHHGAPRDFDDALEGVQSGQEKRDEDFRRAFASERDREDILTKKFERARERTRGDDSRPKNPLDEL